MNSTTYAWMFFLHLNCKYGIYNMSIHTALAGCDHMLVCNCQIHLNFNPYSPRRLWLDKTLHLLPWLYFNPHSPRRLWRSSPAIKITDAIISIHTALAGCDLRGSYRQPGTIPISIHTALAGCDSKCKLDDAVWVNFNPHSPRRLWPRS